ncbi:Alpha-tocopherol transfer protein-like, partial [Orchesella cincta]
MRFLRFKSEPRRAYETLVKYHDFRKSDKNFFSQMRPSAMKYLLDSKVITKLPGNDVKGRPVLLLNFKRWDQEVCSVEDIIRLIMLFFEEIMRTQGSFPISFKAVHQVNQSKTFWLVSKILFSFFSAKLKNRMHIHGTDRESLAAHIPLSSLPVDYGGTAEGDVDTAFIDEMYKNEQYYEALANFD